VDEPTTLRPRVELIGTHLRAEGSVELGQFNRISDYVNILTGFFNIHDVVLLSRLGEPTRITFAEFRVRLDGIAIVAQHQPEANPGGSGPWGDTATRAPESSAFDTPRSTLLEGHGLRGTRGVDDGGIDTAFTAAAGFANAGVGRRVDKERRRLVISTAAHMVYGDAHVHQEASMTAFLDATDPHFIPMTDVRVRWLTDRRLAGRFPFALVQRDHILGVAMDVSAGRSLLRGRDAAADPWRLDGEATEPG
jgi:uncharacterized protein DUF6812